MLILDFGIPDEQYKEYGADKQHKQVNECDGHVEEHVVRAQVHEHFTETYVQYILGVQQKCHNFSNELCVLATSLPIQVQFGIGKEYLICFGLQQFNVSVVNSGVPSERVFNQLVATVKVIEVIRYFGISTGVVQ